MYAIHFVCFYLCRHTTEILVDSCQSSTDKHQLAAVRVVISLDRQHSSTHGDHWQMHFMLCHSMQFALQ